MWVVGSLTVAGLVVVGGLGVAVVSGNGRDAAVAAVGAVTGSVATGLVVRWRTGQELAAEIAANDRWNLADTRYDLDELPSVIPPRARRGL